MLLLLLVLISHVDFSRCRGVSFYVSGASVPGEGELKCIDWVKHMCSSGTEESTVIIGGDADLILQGLALGQVCVHQIFVVVLFAVTFLNVYSCWPCESSIVELGIGDALRLVAPSPFEVVQAFPPTARMCYTGQEYVRIFPGGQGHGAFIVDVGGDPLA